MFLSAQSPGLCYNKLQMVKEQPLDIRWQQRFQNFEKACAELHEACQKKTYSKLERGGLIQAFEFTHELDSV